MAGCPTRLMPGPQLGWRQAGARQISDDIHSLIVLWNDAVRGTTTTNARCGGVDVHAEATAGRCSEAGSGVSSGRSSGVAIAYPAARATFANLSAPLDQFLAIACTFQRCRSPKRDRLCSVNSTQEFA